MLLYTRKAVPKVPKKRSRAGCDYCRIKKKKCDERRPICARCKEAGEECVYGPLRPRQRRTAAQIEADAAAAAAASSEKSDASMQQGDAEKSNAPQPIEDNSWQDVDMQGGGGDDGIDDFIPETYGELGDSSDLDMIFPPSNASTVAQWSPAHRHAGAFYATPHLELNMPLFSEYTSIKGRRGLLDHFSNVLSHLIVLREDEGNPFQQLVLPMSRQSPAVASAIYALSSAHLEFRGVAGGGEHRSILFHSEAARNLANLIEHGAEGKQNELLAAVILLIYYEVLVHRERSQIVNGHLKGAMAILNSGPATSDPTRAFLERAFRFYDVIAALSFRTPTLSNAPPPGSIDHFLPVDSRGTSRPAGSADALLGMATSLWPVVHQLSNLGALKDRVVRAEAAGTQQDAKQLRAELEMTASAIEASLVAWEPELSPDQAAAADSSGPLRGILDNARAYRHSCMVHLYRSIYGARRDDATVQQHTHASLQFCIGTVESAGPMGALLWPLFVAACEARTPDDRNIATRAFTGIAKHQGMANIAQSWQIVQEVWRRADEGAARRCEDGGVTELGIGLQNSSLEGHGHLNSRGAEFGEEDLWRQVCRDMGLAVVFG